MPQARLVITDDSAWASCIDKVRDTNYIIPGFSNLPSRQDVPTLDDDAIFEHLLRANKLVHVDG